jgi:hypothetical protein
VSDTILECASNALQHRLLKKILLKEIFSQDAVPLALRCFNVACGTVSWDKISFNRFFLVAYIVEHYFHIPEWYHTPKSDF